MQRIRSIFRCPRSFRPRCLRGEYDISQYTNDVYQETERPEFSGPVPCDAGSFTGKIIHLEKQLEIELKVKLGAETLIQAYHQLPIKDVTHLDAAKRLLEECNSKIEVIRAGIVLAKQQSPEKAGDNGEEVPEAAQENIDTAPVSSPVVDVEILELPQCDIKSEQSEAASHDDVQECGERIEIQEEHADLLEPPQDMKEELTQAVCDSKDFKGEEQPEELHDPSETHSQGDLPEPSQNVNIQECAQVSSNVCRQEFEVQDLNAEISVDQVPVAPTEPPATSSHGDLLEPLQTLNIQEKIETETPSNAPKESASFDFPEPPQALTIQEEPNIETPSSPQTEFADFDLPEPPQVDNIQEEPERETPSVPPKESFSVELLEPPQTLNMQEEPERGTPSGAPKESISVDLLEPPQTFNIQEEPETEAPSAPPKESHAQESGLEPSKDPDTKALDVEESISPGSADKSILRPFPVGLQDFRYSAVLGRGSFGKVLLAEYKDTGRMYAIKAIKKAHMIKKKFVKRLMYEKEIFQIVSSVRHPFLVNLFASIQDVHRIYFIMEYAAGGDLLSNIIRTCAPFPEEQVMFFAACITLGLECLHQNKIIHRDLKLENVVIDQQGFAKITDFGLSKAGIGLGDHTRSNVGTPYYKAPELISRQPYTKDVDWWSFGILTYEMLYGELPFYDSDTDKLNYSILNTEVAYPFDWSPESVSLLTELLEKNPEMRLGTGEDDSEEVKAHPFFKEIQWTALLSKEVRPPFVPNISDPEDIGNFNEEFTSMAPTLTPPLEPGPTEEEQDLFKDFEWMAE